MYHRTSPRMASPAPFLPQSSSHSLFHDPSSPSKSLWHMQSRSLHHHILLRAVNEEPENLEQGFSEEDWWPVEAVTPRSRETSGSNMTSSGMGTTTGLFSQQALPPPRRFISITASEHECQAIARLFRGSSGEESGPYDAM